MKQWSMNTMTFHIVDILLISVQKYSKGATEQVGDGDWQK